MTLSATERLFWRCGAHAAKPESASRGRLLMTKVCCFLWRPAVQMPIRSPFAPPALPQRSGGRESRAGAHVYTKHDRELPQTAAVHPVKLSLVYPHTPHPTPQLSTGPQTWQTLTKHSGASAA